MLTRKVMRLTARAWIAPCAAVLMTTPTALAQMPKSDVLAPAGVTVGMTPEKARDALAAAGWKQKSKCEYHLGPQGKAGSPRVNFFTAKQGGGCRDGEPIRHIQYKYRGDGAIDGAAAVDRLNAEIGGPAACKDPATERKAQCAWNVPARFPLVNLIDLDVAGQFLTLHSYAVPNLDRPHTPPEPLDAAFDPMTPAVQTNPLEPSGLKVGMPLDEAEQALAAAGYTKSRSSITCTWSLERKYQLKTQITLQTKNKFGQTTRCVEGEPIHHIAFRKIDYRPAQFENAPAPEALTASWTKQVKAQEAHNACSKKGAAEALCLWGPEKGKDNSYYVGTPPPAGVPGLEAIRLTYKLRPREHSITVEAEISGAKIEPTEKNDPRADATRRRAVPAPAP